MLRSSIVVRRGLALAAVVSVLAAVSFASTVPADAYSRKVTQACKFDYKRLCPRYRVGSSQMRACMEAKQSEISARCYDALLDSGEGGRGSRRRR